MQTFQHFSARHVALLESTMVYPPANIAMDNCPFIDCLPMVFNRDFPVRYVELPNGKHTNNWGKPPFLIGKSAN